MFNANTVVNYQWGFKMLFKKIFCISIFMRKNTNSL